ncbi:MAG: S9 family peptidase, partial [Cyanobacteria bacterium J06639_18]
MHFFSRFFATLLAVFLLPVLMVSAQQPTITPGDNLVVEGLPQIPVSLVDTVERYTQFRSASIASWHPTKRQMLISTRFGDTRQVHLVESPLAARKQLTFFSERVGGATFQPTKGDYFVFSKDIGGNEFNQNFRYDFATGDIKLLTDGKSKNSRGVWSNSGDRMIYSSTRRTGKDRDLYIIQPQNPESDKLLAEVNGGGWFGLNWSPDDSQFLVLEYVSINESYLWLFDTRTGDKKLITPKKEGKEKVAYNGGIFTKDGKGLYVITDRDSEFSRLAYLDLTTFEHTYLSSDIPWNVEDFDLSEDGKNLAFVTNEDGTGVLHILDTATRKEKPLPELPVGQIYGVRWHRNNEDLGFTLVSARSTADVYSLNIISNKV